MSARRRRRLSPMAVLPLLLIPLILIVVGLQLRQPPVAPELPDVQPPPEADYYLRDAELSTMDANGELLYRVHAANVLHFPDQHITLQDVDVDYLDGPWQLTAASGSIPPSQQSLHLTGSVQMQGRLRSGLEVSLLTDSLAVHFDAQRIETDAPVQMSSETVRATARGMRTDLAGRELKLLSEVRVRYEP